MFTLIDKKLRDNAIKARSIGVSFAFKAIQALQAIRQKTEDSSPTRNRMHQIGVTDATVMYLYFFLNVFLASISATSLLKVLVS
jgi:enoyl-[acyl-carrier-protein] reductase (NADH)